MPRRAAHIITARPRAAALIAGAISATGFAPLFLWPVTLTALALLLELLRQAPRLRDVVMIGWLFGLGHFFVGLGWLPTAFTFQAKMPAWLGWVALALLCLYLALFIALPAALGWMAMRGARRPGHRSQVLVFAFAAAWIFSEWLRSWLLTGFAWNPLAAIAPWGAQAATLVGSYGQSGLVALLAGAGWLALRGRGRQSLTALAPVLLAGVGGLGVTLWGAAHASGPATPLTIVQPLIEQDDKWDLEQREQNFRKLAGLSPALDHDGPPRLLLWPEAAVPDYLEPGYPLDWYIAPPGFVRARLAALLRPGDVMLTGAVRLNPDADGRDVESAYNSVSTLDAQGQLGPHYDKAHLVPFGEYLPLRPLLSSIGISRLAPGAVDFLPGPGPRTLDLGGHGRVGMQICYEIIFSGQVVDRASRPDFIFNPSNDAWFGAWGPPQHLAQARLRALEEGLPVLRSTPTGISAVIAADGSVRAQLPMHRAGRIDLHAPPAHPATPFALVGNLLPLLLTGALAILAIALGQRRR